MYKSVPEWIRALETERLGDGMLVRLRPVWVMVQPAIINHRKHLELSKFVLSLHRQ